MTAAEVLARVELSWRELDDLVTRMDDGTLAKPGPEGWAVKDHLVHLGAWERSTLALLEGRDREAAMGITPAAGQSIDAVNDAVFRLRRDMPPSEALRYFRDSHTQLVEALSRLKTADLERPYSSYQPSDPDESRPVIGWVEGNTFEHYAEHIEWIKRLV